MDIVFFARVKDLDLLYLLEFYREDIEILRELGHDVFVHNSVRQAMLARGDVLFAWWWATALPVLLVWRLRRKPAICTGATDFDNPLLPRWKRRIKQVLARLAGRMAQANLSISDFELKSLARIGAISPQTVHLSIDTDFYRPGMLSKDPSAVIVAQLNLLSIRRKGVDVAVAAAQCVAAKIPGFVLTVIGPADEAGQGWMNATVGDHHCVRFLGRLSRSDKAAVLASSWLYVQPSVYEGFGLAVVEAMASGCRPVVSRLGSLPEVVGQAGSFVESGDVEAVAREIIRLVTATDTEQRRTEAREQALQFSREHRVMALREVLDRVSARRPACAE